MLNLYSQFTCQYLFCFSHVSLIPINPFLVLLHVAKQHRKTKKYKRGENSYKNHGWTIWEEREREDITIPTRSKVKYMYIYKSKYLHFYKGPILSIYLYWICTGDGITLHILYIFTVQLFFSPSLYIIKYSKKLKKKLKNNVN